MKQIPAAMAAELAKETGIEPVCIVEVQWVEDGPFIAYSDQQYPEEPSLKGQILSISTLEAVVKLDQSGQSQSIDVKLSDTNGELKDIIDVHNVHGRVVNVYQWVRGLPLSEKFLLYQGEINGPIEWDSGDRTLGFEVITQLANKEVGFSPEQGLFADVPNPLVGVAWPIVFGLNQNVPAVPIQDFPRTQTLEPLGVRDPTLLLELLRITAVIADLEGLLLFYAQALGFVEHQITFYGRTDLIGLANSLQNTVDQIAAQLAQARQDYFDLLFFQGSQRTNSTLEVANADRYPQLTTIIIVVDNPDGSNVHLQGYFNGNTFHVGSATPDDYNPFTAPDPDNLYGPATQPFGFTFVQAGATVRIETDNEVRYIANLNRSEVRIVRAYRGETGSRRLTVVPTNLYTVQYHELGPFEVTMIHLPRALKDIDSLWENDLYVTQEDVLIGSNTVDIVQWLVETFTDLAIDSASFATVHTQLNNYPSHFALLDQWNVLDLLESILFQARTVGFVSNNTVFLKYLSYEASPTSTIEDKDVKAGSIRMLSTPTEDLVTKLVATWTDDYAIEDPYRIVLRYNVPTYGVRVREIDFFIYNIEELVIKSATFWIIRLGNIWKRARFKTFLNKMAVETFDTIRISLSGSFFVGTANDRDEDVNTVSALVTDVTYDSAGSELAMECWLPVKFGKLEPYIFAWPAAAPVDEFYPQPDEIDVAGSDPPQSLVEGDIEFGPFN